MPTLSSDALVGRGQEFETALTVLGTGRHLLVRGPAGVGKTALGAAVCARLGSETVRVDGDDAVSGERLAGWFDPPLVLRLGYRADAFVPGPLVRAMRAGAVLFANDLDRVPESAQNLLLPALDEGLVQVPHLGVVRAAPGFLVVATSTSMAEAGAVRASEALRDRFEFLELGFQGAAEEEAVVRLRTGCEDGELVRAAVRLTRATRMHPALRRGASVRGAIAVTALAARLRGVSSLRDAAEAALSTRVDLDPESGTGLAHVLDELVEVARGDDELERRWAVAMPRRHRRAPAAGGDERDADPGGPALDVAVRAPDVRRRLAASLSSEVAELDGWDLASRLSAGRLPSETGLVRLYAEQLAAAEVLRRARRLVGPLRAGTQPLREPLREPFAGELCLEATLENLLGKPWAEEGDLVVERREERRREVVLMIDTSLSMAGEPMALAAVAAAAMALKLHAGDLSLVLFSDEARVVSRLRAQVSAPELVRRMLARPCGGATNVAAALDLGLAELRRGRDPRRSAVLVSDGVYTAGPDPRAPAARFSALHVLLMEEGARDRGAAGAGRGPADPARRGRSEGFWLAPKRIAGRDLAALAGGRVVPVTSFRQLPRRMVDLADHVLR